MTLTHKQQRFVEEYLVDGNGRRAAIAAGYSEATATEMAHENLSKPHVAGVIEEKRRAVAERLEITPEKVMAELAKLAFVNMQDFARAGGDWTKLTRAQMAAITEIHLEERTEIDGDRPATVRVAKIKLADKKGALVDLGKFLGMDKLPQRQGAVEDEEKPYEAGNPELSNVIQLYRKRGLA